jgi:hypothetical protein
MSSAMCGVCPEDEADVVRIAEPAFWESSDARYWSARSDHRD